MKVAIRNRSIPTDHNVLPEMQFLFAEKDGVCEITIITNRDPTFLAYRKMNTVHRTVRA
jgi:hypothetical protein